MGRFVAEMEAAAAGKGELKPGYVLAGDEAFLLDRCRAAVLKAFVPQDLRDFCLSDLDLSGTSIFEVLDRAQTPSLMAPFQVVFVRNVKQLYTRGAKKDEFAALERYFRSPNPQALLIFLADFIHIPSDARRMELDDKNRFERLTETLGAHCGMVELAGANEEDAMRWVAATAQEQGARVEADAARELVDALGADMMLISSELEKLLLYTLGRGRITLGDVETMVLAAKQRSRPGTRAGAAAGAAEQFGGRRGCGHRAPLYAGANLPSDAGDSGKECARLAGDLAGAVAGVPDAAVCRR
jgi:DNA polymerase-3 subunit delta